jgi:hypothetical protein
MSNSNVGFVVLPPGHGKSHHHNTSLGLYTIDSLVVRESSPYLLATKKYAHKSGDWSHHNLEWARLLNDALEDETRRILVMVPHASIGKAAGWADCGGLILEQDQWAQNFVARSDSSDNYQGLWFAEMKRGGRMVLNNKDLGARLLEIFYDWVAE